MEKDDLGKFLREKRLSRKMSLRQLAKCSKEQSMENDKAVTYSHISKIENGDASPSLHTLQKIAAALDLPLVIILDGEHLDPDMVTVVSTPEFPQTILSALRREELVQLMLLCQRLTADQMKDLLDFVSSLPHASFNQDEEGSP